MTCDVDTSVDRALDILLENKEQLLVAKDQFGGTAGLVTMEDIIETLLGVEIVDESDQDAIDDGVLHEDMRELAKRRFDSESRIERSLIFRSITSNHCLTTIPEPLCSLLVVPVSSTNPLTRLSLRSLRATHRRTGYPIVQDHRS